MSYVILAFGAQLSVYVGMLLIFMREKCPSYLIFSRTILFVNLIFQVWLYHLVMSWLYAFGQIDISYLVASFGDVWSCPFGRIDIPYWLYRSVMFGCALLVELITLYLALPIVTLLFG